MHHIDKIFPTLLKTLSDSNDEVVIYDLRVLALICKPDGNIHFKPFMKSLYRLFKHDRNLLHTKGPYIIRQLSVYLSSVDIYQSMTEMIEDEQDLKFARLYVEYLNAIMFTAKELYYLREQIKKLETPVSHFEFKANFLLKFDCIKSVIAFTGKQATFPMPL